MAIVKKLTATLFVIFLIYAFFGAIGIEFRYIDILIALVPVFTIAGFTTYQFNYVLDAETLAYLILRFHWARSYVVKIILILASSIGLFIAVWWFLNTLTGTKVLSSIARHWRSLPSFAQINPVISTLISIISLVLSFLAHRRASREERRKLEELMRENEEAKSLVIKPATDDIFHYGRKR